jgi:hypothetical protein
MSRRGSVNQRVVFRELQIPYFWVKHVLDGMLLREIVVSRPKESAKQHTSGIETIFTNACNVANFLIKNPALFLLAPLSGVLALGCPLTLEDIPDNLVFKQFTNGTITLDEIGN